MPEMQPCVAQFPSKADCNPYIGLLKNSLSDAGLTIHEHTLFLEGRGYPYPRLDEEWLHKHQGRVNVLHFHWLQKFYKSDDAEASEVKIEAFGQFLALARRLDYRIVYTFHNIIPHEGMGPDLDLRVRRIMIDNADAVTCFSERQKTHLESIFGAMPITVIPHPSYLGYYKDEVGREESRRMLGLSENARVFTYIGLVRPYKHLPRLLQAFRELKRDDCFLLIGGSALDEEFGASIARSIDGTRNTICHFRWIDDDEVQVFLNAADAVVLPYEKCWTSGAIMLAFSFGRPVITADPVMLDEPDGLGFYYDSDSGVEEALARAIDSTELPLMGERCRAFARARPWHDAGRRLASIYKQICAGGRTETRPIVKSTKGAS